MNRLLALAKEIWSLLKDGFRGVFLDDIREGLIDLRPVRWDVRLLAVAGLVTVLVTMAATLFFGHGYFIVGKVAYETGTTNNVETFAIPFFALTLATIVFAVGWGAVLTGAARCRWWVFLLIGLFFLLQLLVLANALLESVLGSVVYLCLLPLTGIGALVSYLVLPRLRHRVWVGLVESIWWTGLVALFVILIWVVGDDGGAVASSFALSLGSVFILSAFYWFYLSTSVVDLGVGIGRWVLSGVRLFLPSQFSRWLILIFLLLKPFLAFALFALTEFAFLSLDVFGSILLVIVVLVLLAIRRYSARASYVLFSISIASQVVFYALELAQTGSDFSSLLLEQLGIVSPLVSFVLLTLWDMASSGARFANTDGKHLPRAGRIVLYTGGLILAATTTLFYSAAGDPTLQETANSALIGGLGTLGLVRFGFIIWRRRELLLGPEIGEREGLGPLRRMSRRGLAVIIALAAVMGICLCGTLWLVWLLPPALAAQ